MNRHKRTCAFAATWIIRSVYATGKQAHNSMRHNCACKLGDCLYATRAATVVLFSVVRGRPKAEVLLSAENQNRNRKSIVSGPKSSASLMSACQGPQATVPDADVVSADSAAQLHRLSLHSLSVHNEANDSLRLAHSLPPQLKLCTILSASTKFTNCSTLKPKVHRMCYDCFRPKPNVRRKRPFVHIRCRSRNSVDLYQLCLFVTLFMSPLRRHIFVCFVAKSAFWRCFSALAPYTGVGPI